SGHWAFQRSPTESLRKLPDGTWSRSDLTGTTVDPEIPDQRCCISEIVSVVSARETPFRGRWRAHLFACRDGRGRPCQPRFPIWGRLSRQIEHRGLDLLPRRLVCFCEPRNHCRRDFSHEAPVFLSRLEPKFAVDVLNHDAFQTAFAKGCLHKSRCRTPEQSRRPRWRRRHRDVLVDCAHNHHVPGILLGCIPDSGAHAPTRSCYPRELLHTHVDIREEHETEPTQYGVERAFWERKSTGVALFSVKVLDSATRGVFGGDPK